jgi:hypothetical protein
MRCNCILAFISRNSTPDEGHGERPKRVESQPRLVPLLHAGKYHRLHSLTSGRG